MGDRYYDVASTERQRIRRIIRAERARYQAIVDEQPALAEACAQAIFVCKTLLNLTRAPRRGRHG